MSKKTSGLKNKTLIIQSSLNVPTFNLKVDDVDHGFIKKHNVTNLTTYNSKIDLTFSILTKETKISLRMMKDENITINWNKIRGRFELLDNEDIIISQKTFFTKFSKIFYPLIVGLFLLIIIVGLLIAL